MTNRIKERLTYCIELDVETSVEIGGLIERFFEKMEFDMPKIHYPHRKGQYLSSHNIAMLLSKEIRNYLNSINVDVIPVKRD